jgi:hypothetical protein
MLDADSQRAIAMLLTENYEHSRSQLCMRRTGKAVQAVIDSAIADFMQAYARDRDAACEAGLQLVCQGAQANDTPLDEQSDANEKLAKARRAIQARARAAFGSKHSAFELLCGTDLRAYVSARTRSCIVCNGVVSVHNDPAFAVAHGLQALSTAEMLGVVVHSKCVCALAVRTPHQDRPWVTDQKRAELASGKHMATRAHHFFVGRRFRMVPDAPLGQRYEELVLETDQRKPLALQDQLVFAPPRLRLVRAIEQQPTASGSPYNPSPDWLRLRSPESTACFVYEPTAGVDARETIATMFGAEDKSERLATEERGVAVEAWRVQLKEFKREKAAVNRAKRLRQRLNGLDQWMGSKDSGPTPLTRLPWSSVRDMCDAIPALHDAFAGSPLQDMSSYGAKNVIASVWRAIRPLPGTALEVSPQFAGAILGHSPAALRQVDPSPTWLGARLRLLAAQCMPTMMPRLELVSLDVGRYPLTVAGATAAAHAGRPVRLDFLLTYDVPPTGAWSYERQAGIGRLFELSCVAPTQWDLREYVPITPRGGRTCTMKLSLRTSLGELFDLAASLREAGTGVSAGALQQLEAACALLRGVVRRFHAAFLDANVDSKRAGIWAAPLRSMVCADQLVPPARVSSEHSRAVWRALAIEMGDVQERLGEAFASLWRDLAARGARGQPEQVLVYQALGLTRFLACESWRTGLQAADGSCLPLSPFETSMLGSAPNWRAYQHAVHPRGDLEESNRGALVAILVMKHYSVFEESDVFKTLVRCAPVAHTRASSSASTAARGARALPSFAEHDTEPDSDSELVSEDDSESSVVEAAGETAPSDLSDDGE